MASSREHQGTARKYNLPYLQSVDYDEYEENESFERTHNQNALFNSEYTEDEGEYEEHEYREGNYEESEYAEHNIDPDSPTSPSNGHPFPSPPPSPPTDDGYDEDNSNTANKFTSVRPPPPPARARSKKLPSIPQTLHVDDKSQSQMALRPSAPTPSHQKRKLNFAIGNLTSKLKFKRSHAKEEEPRNIDPPPPEPPQRIQITLPSLAPSSPISHQLPAEYLEFEEEQDNHSEVQTTPELTMDDLYHVVLNMQKGFQLQVDEMNTQIKELKREIRRLKGEESEEEQEEEANDLEDFRSPSRTATSVRSVAKEMERYGGEGRWFHNEYS